MGTHEHFIDLGQDYLVRITSLMREVAAFSHRPTRPDGAGESVADPAIQTFCQRVSDLLSIPRALAFEVLQGKVAVKFDAAIVTLTLSDLQKQLLLQG